MKIITRTVETIYSDSVNLIFASKSRKNGNVETFCSSKGKLNVKLAETTAILQKSNAIFRCSFYTVFYENLEKVVFFSRSFEPKKAQIYHLP